MYLILSVLLFAQSSGVVDIYPLRTSGAVDVNHGGIATACWQLHGAVGVSLSEPCGGYSANVAGAPVRVQYAGTWPEGLDGTQGEAWDFGGVGALTRADDGTFDPADDFTVIAAFIPHSVAAGDQCLAAKWESTGNERGWKLCRNGTSITFSVSVDGIGAATLTRVNAAEIHTVSYVTATYDQSGTTADLYVDNLSVATSGAFPASIHDSSANFEIGASDTGAFVWDGWIYDVIYVPSYMTEADHAFMHAQWRGTISAAGLQLTTITTNPSAFMAAPPDSGAEPFFHELPDNTVQVGSVASGSGGVFSANGPSNLVHRGTFETWAAGSPTGWTETSGGGTSDATQNTTSMAHGFSSAAMVCDGVNTLTLDSACKAFGATTNYWGDVWLRTTAGTADVSVQIIEYTSVNCTTGATTTTLWNGDPGSWSVRGSTQGGARTTGAGVQSGRLRISIQNNAATVLADGAFLWSNIIPTDALCVADTDATASCGHVNMSIVNQPLGPNETFSVCSVTRTPVDVTLASLFPAWHLGGTYGAANSCLPYSYTGLWRWRCWNQAAGTGTINMGAAATNTDTYICGSMTASGQIWGYNTTTSYGPASPGYRNAVFPEIQIGGYGNSGYVNWNRDLVIYRRLVQ